MFADGMSSYVMVAQVAMCDNRPVRYDVHVEHFTMNHCDITGVKRDIVNHFPID